MLSSRAITQTLLTNTRILDTWRLSIIALSIQERQILTICLTMPYLNSLASVSYTHLDVYKRQVQGGSNYERVKLLPESRKNISHALFTESDWILSNNVRYCYGPNSLFHRVYLFMGVKYNSVCLCEKCLLLVYARALCLRALSLFHIRFRDKEPSSVG